VCDTLSENDIMVVLSSIRDSNSYQASNARPVQRMLFYLTELFSPDERSSARSLRLSYGDDGAKLSHSHATQYTFVKQSLLLWLNITQQMFGLWLAADDDLLSAADYRLCNTGQGLNRVQSCPNVSRAMHGILGRVQAACGGWVGLSVVHLGDRDVPNALVFIDKVCARMCLCVCVCVCVCFVDRRCPADMPRSTHSSRASLVLSVRLLAMLPCSLLLSFSPSPPSSHTHTHSLSLSLSLSSHITCAHRV
jgi:hypothetical protein